MVFQDRTCGCHHSTMKRLTLCIIATVFMLYFVPGWDTDQRCHRLLLNYTNRWFFYNGYYEGRYSDNLNLALANDRINSNYNWILTTDKFVPNYYQRTPYISNGYIGQRLPAEGVGYWIDVNSDGEYVKNSWPLDQPRATFGTIAGFWNLQARTKHVLLPDNLKRGGESVVSGIPDWTGLILTTSDGHAYMPGVNKGTIIAYHQSMSIRNGIVRTNITWSPSDPNNENTRPIQYQLNFTVLAHRERPNVGIVRLDISATDEANCSIIDVLDGAGSVRANFEEKAIEEDQNAIWTSVRPQGIENVTAYVFSTVGFESSDSRIIQKINQTRRNATSSHWVSQNLSTVAQSWDFCIAKDEYFTITKYVGVASSDAFYNKELSTARMTAIKAKEVGWESLVKEHQLAWDRIWDSADIIIPVNDELQTGVRASLFHILAGILPDNMQYEHMSSDNSITVGGLSSDSYAGLIFWDADTWIYPSILALQPSFAKTINEYRTRLLPQAISNAQLYNYSGALYPWTSGRFGNCTGTGVCKDYQYHLNTDIALAHWQYFQNTRDISWLREKGWPVIKNVADMFAAYVVPNSTTGEYETLLLGEPDEFAYFKNNGAYTNAGIKKLLGHIGPAAAGFLGQAIPQNWSVIADRIRIPIDLDSNITLGFDGMQGDWKVKQASVALMNYPLGYRISEDHTRNDITYYSAANTPDGPAMTWSIFAISEAQLQKSGCAAYSYLLRSGEPYFRQPYYQFSETAVDNHEGSENFNPAFPFGLHPAFPFLTGAGGYLQVFTHGLTGMRPHVDFLYFDPTLPPQIPDGFTIKGIKWQGSAFDVSINLNDTTIMRRQLLTSADDFPVTLQIRNKEYTLHAGESLKVRTRRPDLNNLLFDGKVNLAQCKPVTSTNKVLTSDEQRWAFGRCPESIVDGSNATFWQPLTSSEASITVDLQYKAIVSGFFINWGPSPARRFAFYSYKVDEGDTITKPVLLYENSHVEISAPFNSSNVHVVKIREGNTTVVQLPEKVATREISLVIEGTQGEEQQLGATVAELIIF